MRPRPEARAFGVTLLAVLAVALPAPALAHEGPGRIRVMDERRLDSSTVRYRVLVTYDADGHPAPGATVTAVVERPGTPPATPVILAATPPEGNYAGEVRFAAPGTWTVRFTSVSPVGTLETSLVISDVAPTMTAVASTSPPSTNLPGDGSGDGGSTGVIVLALAIVAVLTVGALAVIGTRRRERRSQ